MEKNNLIVKAVNKNVKTSPRKLALVCNFIKGKRITGLNNISNNSLIFHSGTKSDKLGNLLTNSGRVLSLTSLAKNIDEARKKVYGDIKKIKFDKAFYRKDIGL